MEATSHARGHQGLDAVLEFAEVGAGLREDDDGVVIVGAVEELSGCLGGEQRERCPSRQFSGCRLHQPGHGERATLRFRIDHNPVPHADADALRGGGVDDHMVNGGGWCASRLQAIGVQSLVGDPVGADRAFGQPEGHRQLAVRPHDECDVFDRGRRGGDAGNVGNLVDETVRDQAADLLERRRVAHAAFEGEICRIVTDAGGLVEPDADVMEQ